MRAMCNGKAVVYAPKLLLIVRLIDAITDRVQGTDDDFAQQSSSRTKCETAHISAREGDVLYRIGKAITHLYLVQNGRRKDAGLVYSNDVFTAAESLCQQITQDARRGFRAGLAAVVVVRAGDRSQFPAGEVVINSA